MKAEPYIWRNWASFLHRWGLKRPLAGWLEVAGPLNILVAQLLYFTQPLLSLVVSDETLESFASVLENPEETRMLIEYLIEEKR